MTLQNSWQSVVGFVKLEEIAFFNSNWLGEAETTLKTSDKPLILENWKDNRCPAN